MLFCNIRFLVLTFACVLCYDAGSNRGEGVSKTYKATRTRLTQIAEVNSPHAPMGTEYGRQGGDGDGGKAVIRTNFYKALIDIEKAIIKAEAGSKSKMSTSRAAKSLVALQKVIISAARGGKYRLGREIFGYARFIQDKSSKSRARKRYTRSSDSFINFIKEKIGDQTFNQFFNIESGTSLTFVLDTSGSMHEDMEQVQKLVKELSTPSQNDEDVGSGFFNFLMAPFSDPLYGPAESYYDKGEFLSALEGIQVEGGGDCDELVLKGMIEGLEMTESSSPVFVFTDAGTKHQEEYDNVLSLSRSYYAPLFFFITPSEDCPQNISTYKRLASETEGQVLSMTKADVGKMGSIIKSRGIGTSLLLSGSDKTKGSKIDKRSTGETQNIEFECDDTVDKLLVSINFNNPTGSSYLLSPSHDLIYPTFMSARTNMRIYEVEDPEPGTWNLKAITDVGNEFTYAVNSVKSANIDFDFYFLTTYRGKDLPTDHAIPGKKMRLKLSILGDFTKIKADKCELYFTDTSGNIMSTVQSLAISKDLDNQYDGVFIVPTETFKLKLYGETKKGNPFTRTSHGSITPSMGLLQPVYNDINKKIIKPGSRGNFYFKFEHYHSTTQDFEVTFTSPGKIITTKSPKQFKHVRKHRSKLVKLAYSVPQDTPDGTEFRITLVASAGHIKIRYVHSVLVTRYAN